MNGIQIFRNNMKKYGRLLHGYLFFLLFFFLFGVMLYLVLLWRISKQQGMMDAEIYEQLTGDLLTGFLIYYVIVILAGAVGGFLKARSSYRNLSRLSAGISGMPEDPAASFSDLQGYIQSALCDYDKKLKLDQVRIREEKLIALFQGKVCQGDFAKTLSVCRIPEGAASYYVISCFLQETKDDPRLLKLTESKFAAIRAAFSQTIEPLCQNISAFWAGARMTDRYSVLLAVPDECKQDTVETLAEDLIHQIEADFGIRAIAMVSRNVGSAEQIPDAFRETEQMFQYVNSVGSEKCMLSYRFLDQQTVLNWDFLRQIGILINLLLMGRFAEVPQQLQDIVKEHISETETPSLASGRIGVLSCILYEAVLTTHMKGFNYETGVQHLNRAVNADDLLSAADEIFCRLAQLSQDGGNDDIVNRTCVYIQQHLDDVNLNVTMLSEAAGVSAQHLSRMFKKQTNLTLMEYVNTLRIDRAKQLLSETDNTIAAVSEQTGYGNAKTFLRNFQTMTGMTPSNYRKAKQN